MNSITLYHGSGFKQNELQPGFKRSGELISWDQTESNKYLYATTDKDSAITLGFASAVDKKYLLDRFINTDDKVIIKLSDKKLPSVSELLSIDVYLYEIRYDEKDGWIKNYNKHNNLNTEYKTKQTIRSNLVRVNKVNIEHYFKDKSIRVSNDRPGYSGW